MEITDYAVPLISREHNSPINELRQREKIKTGQNPKPIEIAGFYKILISTGLHKIMDIKQEHQYSKQKDNCSRPLFIIGKGIPGRFIQPKKPLKQTNRNLHKISRKYKSNFKTLVNQ